MVNFKEFEIIVKNIPLSEEERGLLIKNVKPFFEFHDFLVEKLKISSQAVEAICDINMKSELKKINFDKIDTEEEFYKCAGKVAKEFAESHNFPRAAELEIAMVEILKIMPN